MSVKDLKQSDKVTIKIPRALYDRLAKIVEGSGFNSVTDFVVYVLRDLAANQLQKQTTPEPEKEALTNEEIEAIRKRLRSLGYL